MTCHTYIFIPLAVYIHREGRLRDYLESKALSCFVSWQGFVFTALLIQNFHQHVLHLVHHNRELEEYYKQIIPAITKIPYFVIFGIN